LPRIYGWSRLGYRQGRPMKTKRVVLTGEKEVARSD